MVGAGSLILVKARDIIQRTYGNTGLAAVHAAQQAALATLVVGAQCPSAQYPIGALAIFLNFPFVAGT